MVSLSELNKFVGSKKIINMYIIYHNPRCSKSRKGLEYLKGKTTDIKVMEYLKKPFTEESLTKLLMQLNKKPHEMIRTHEAIYKSDYKGKNFTDEEWVKIMVETPRLIHRPIILKGNKAVWGQPIDEIDVLF